MSFTALALYALKRSEFQLEDIREGWLQIQEERAERNFQKAIASESPAALEYLKEDVSRYRSSEISRILEPGYQEKMEELIDQHEETSV